MSHQWCVAFQVITILMSHSDPVFYFNVWTKNVFNDKIRFDGKSVEEAKSLNYQHSHIYHLAKYRGQPFTTGSWSGHAKTEIMRLESGEWESGPDYPFHSW